MDESPAMKERREAAILLQRKPEGFRQCMANRGGANDQQLKWKETPPNINQVLELGRHNIGRAMKAIVQDLSKVQHSEERYNLIQTYFTNQCKSLSALSHSIWAKVVEAGKHKQQQRDRGPLLASATTTALPQISPSMWSHSISDELHPESWIHERSSFDAFLDGRDLEPSRQQIERPSWVAEPSDSTLSVAEEVADRAIEGWSGFIRPVDNVWRISSGFGPRWGRQHNGVDLAAPTGEPVLAADSGEVTYAGWEPGGYGYLVEITHRDGWKTLYAHNSEIFTWEGQIVRRGDCIATVGETGRATGPHLHWEIRNNQNKPVDPSDHMKL